MRRSPTSQCEGSLVARAGRGTFTGRLDWPPSPPPPPFPRTVNMVAHCSLGLNGVAPYVGRRSKRKIPWVGSGPLMARALPDTWPGPF
ncbi:hypothetical protein HaLaN_31467 [Haematococcus lacustris]|uniref:Uncharacterized protein n=1 Tax=Haematococcus lacustris TaxID=44745 RepID=A0A6A0AHW9_HAELA|nr:hypothetical protein HaLaN_31467 [Haematococcus lacustris]